MKKLFLLLIFTVLYFQSIAQDTKPGKDLMEDLVKKSDNQFKAGMVLLTGGTAMLITAIAIPNRYDFINGTTNQRTINFFTWTGLLSISTSIPLFLSSGNNGRTAAKLSLQSQVLDTPLPGTRGNFTALSLKFPIR